MHGVAVMAAVADIVLDISCNSSSRRYFSLRNRGRKCRHSLCICSKLRCIRMCMDCWGKLRRQWWWWEQWRRFQRLTIQVTHDRVFSHRSGLTPRYYSPPLYIHVQWVHSSDSTHGDVMLSHCFHCWYIMLLLCDCVSSAGAGSGVVKSLGCGARGPGFESRWRWKCWAVMELFVNIYLWVYPMFSMRAYSLFRFVLIKLRYWGEPSACI